VSEAPAPRARSPIVVGVAGGIASGKSTLVSEWERLGARSIDLDRVGWSVLSQAEVRESLLYAFGPDILDAAGEVDRSRLAAKAFADAESAETLNAILHPPILAAAERWIEEERRAAASPVLVVEASLIMEAGRLDLFDYVVLVASGRETRLARLAAKGIDRADATARMRFQWDDETKRPLADFVVENDGAPEALTRAARSLWQTVSGLPARPRGAANRGRGHDGPDQKGRTR